MILANIDSFWVIVYWHHEKGGFSLPAKPMVPNKGYNREVPDNFIAF